MFLFMPQIKMNNKFESIKEYYRQFNANEKIAKKAYRERSRSGSKKDVLETHALPFDMLELFRKILQPVIRDIREVYLVKRKVKFIPEDPLYIIIVKTCVQWYEIRLHNPKQIIGDYLCKNLQGFFQKGTYTVTVDFPMYINKAKAIPGALVYKNKARE